MEYFRFNGVSFMKNRTTKKIFLGAFTLASLFLAACSVVSTHRLISLSCRSGNSLWELSIYKWKQQFRHTDVTSTGVNYPLEFWMDNVKDERPKSRITKNLSASQIWNFGAESEDSRVFAESFLGVDYILGGYTEMATPFPTAFCAVYVIRWTVFHDFVYLFIGSIGLYYLCLKIAGYRKLRSGCL